MKELNIFQKENAKTEVHVEYEVEMRTGRAGPRAGPGRAGLTFLGPRAERAENGPKSSPERNKVYLKKPKILIKLT